MQKKISRKNFLQLSLFSAAALGAGSLAACSTGAKDSDNSGQGDYLSPLEDSQFPRTFTNAFGEATLETAPKNIVATSQTNADLLLSLGVAVTACAKAGWGENENDSYDWFDEKLKDLGASNPARFDETDSIPFSSIAAQNPDVIVDTFGALSSEDYSKLSAIAPVICFEKDGGNYTTSWQDSIRILGKALGLEDEASQVVSDTTKKLSGVIDQYPQIKDATYIATAMDPSQDPKINIYSAKDSRSSFFTSIGMKPAALYTELNFDSDNFYLPFSDERISELDSDMIYTWSADQDQTDRISKDPVIQSIPAVEHGGLFIAQDKQETTAMGTSPLAMDWLLTTDFINTLSGVVSASKANQGKSEER